MSALARGTSLQGRLELPSGLEPETSSLPRRCSTTELRQRRLRVPRRTRPIDPLFSAPLVTPRGAPSHSPGDPDVRAGAPGRAGAGEGNRTLVSSLEGYRSTIELRPPGARSRLRPTSARSSSTRPDGARQ